MGHAGRSKARPHPRRDQVTNHNQVASNALVLEQWPMDEWPGLLPIASATANRLATAPPLRQHSKRVRFLDASQAWQT